MENKMIDKMWQLVSWQPSCCQMSWWHTGLLLALLSGLGLEHPISLHGHCPHCWLITVVMRTLSMWSQHHMFYRAIKIRSWIWGGRVILDADSLLCSYGIEVIVPNSVLIERLAFRQKSDSISNLTFSFSSLWLFLVFTLFLSDI